MNFEKWLDKVDEQFVAITKLDRDTWPDQDYWSMFDDEMAPIVTGKQIGRAHV